MISKTNRKTSDIPETLFMKSDSTGIQRSSVGRKVAGYSDDLADSPGHGVVQRRHYLGTPGVEKWVDNSGSNNPFILCQRGHPRPPTALSITNSPIFISIRCKNAAHRCSAPTGAAADFTLRDTFVVKPDDQPSLLYRHSGWHSGEVKSPMRPFELLKVFYTATGQ